MIPERAGSPSGHAPRSHLAERTHVLFVIDQLCEMGGAERVLLNMIRLLPKDRFRCTLATFKIDPRFRIFKNFPCAWSVFPMHRSYDWNALQVAMRLRHLIRTGGVHIVHTFFETSDLFGGLIAKLSGAPVLVSSRRDLGILRNWKHHLGYRVLSPLYDLVLAVSDGVREFCIRQDHLNPERVLTLYNGIETEKVPVDADASGLRDSMGLSGASHLISTVGHIRKVKGLDILIRAAAKVCQQFPRAVFLVIGDVHERQYYQQLLDLTESLELKQNVKFIGPSEDVFSLLRISDIFCLPSRSEGFSNALVEAMACSLPCVATRVGGNSEALEEGRSGFLVESEDHDAIANRILTLVRAPERAKEMGREGRRMVEAKFTTQAMISRLVNVYDTLLSAKKINNDIAVRELS
jgi:L-malate glycosyltransferase